MNTLTLNQDQLNQLNNILGDLPFKFAVQIVNLLNQAAQKQADTKSEVASTEDTTVTQ